MPPGTAGSLARLTQEGDVWPEEERSLPGHSAMTQPEHDVSAESIGVTLSGAVTSLITAATAEDSQSAVMDLNEALGLQLQRIMLSEREARKRDIATLKLFFAAELDSLRTTCQAEHAAVHQSASFVLPDVQRLVALCEAECSTAREEGRFHESAAARLVTRADDVVQDFEKRLEELRASLSIQLAELRQDFSTCVAAVERCHATAAAAVEVVQSRRSPLQSPRPAADGSPPRAAATPPVEPALAAPPSSLAVQPPPVQTPSAQAPLVQQLPERPPVSEAGSEVSSTSRGFSLSKAAATFFAKTVVLAAGQELPFGADVPDSGTASESGSAAVRHVTFAQATTEEARTRFSEASTIGAATLQGQPGEQPTACMSSSSPSAYRASSVPVVLARGKASAPEPAATSARFLEPVAVSGGSDNLQGVLPKATSQHSSPLFVPHTAPFSSRLVAAPSACTVSVPSRSTIPGVVVPSSSAPASPRLPAVVVRPPSAEEVQRARAVLQACSSLSQRFQASVSPATPGSQVQQLTVAVPSGYIVGGSLTVPPVSARGSFGPCRGAFAAVTPRVAQASPRPCLRLQKPQQLPVSPTPPLATPPRSPEAAAAAMAAGAVAGATARQSPPGAALRSIC